MFIAVNTLFGLVFIVRFHQQLENRSVSNQAWKVVQDAMKKPGAVIRTPADLARALTRAAQLRNEPEVTNQHVNNWQKRGVPASRFADIADVLNISIGKLHGYEKNLRLAAAREIVAGVTSPPQTIDASSTFIEVQDLLNEAGAGGVALVDDDLLAGIQHIPVKRLIQRGVRTEDFSRLRGMRVRGDSMEDYLFDGDSIVVLPLTERDQLMEGESYVLRASDELRVKRLRRQFATGWIIIESYNDKKYPPEVVPPDAIEVIARVVHRAG